MATTEEPELLQQVRTRFDAANAAWLPKVFAEGGTLVDARGDGSERPEAWRYRFEMCRFAFAVADAGPKCGDNGGVRTNGVPCGRRARRDGDGRCATHPYFVVELTFAGDADGDRRPLPAAMPWEDVRIVADGREVVAVTPPVEALAPFVSATEVWTELTLEMKAGLEGLPPDAWLELPSGDREPVDPGWRSEKLLDMHPECRKLNGFKVIPGYFLKDFGLEPDGSAYILK